MKIERALYGLIESAKLRYEEFTGFLKSLGFLPNPYDPCVLNLDYKDETYTSVLYMDDCFLDCYNPEQLNYVKQIIVIILLRNMAGARTSMEMYCHTLGCYLTFGNSGCKSGHAQLFRGCHFGPQIGQPRRYAGRIGALGYLGGCRFAGQIDKNNKVLRISVDARGIVGASITVVVSRLYY